MSLVSYKLSDYTNEQINSIINVLNSLGMPMEINSEFREQFETIKLLDYHLISVEDTITQANTITICAHLIWEYMIDYILILKKFKTSAQMLSTLKEKQEISFTHGHTITTKEEKRNMSEDAPITSGATQQGEPIYTINTPKDRYNANNESSDTHSGTDAETKSNPYYWTEYINLLAKYNISKILLDSIRYCTKEYQSVN